MNVAFTLGMRAGLAALRELNLGRNDVKTAIVSGGDFFGQGIEAVTGCSVIDGTMEFHEDVKSLGNFSLVLQTAGTSVKIRIREQLHSGADEVMTASEEQLFQAVEVGAFAS